jgi:hypothetical protein
MLVQWWRKEDATAKGLGDGAVEVGEEVGSVTRMAASRRSAHRQSLAVAVTRSTRHREERVLLVVNRTGRRSGGQMGKQRPD